MTHSNGNGKGSINFVFPISQELKDQGISGFRIKDENAILTLQNGPKDEMVLFPFYRKNYSRSIEKMKVGLEARHVDDRMITIYCLKITELLLEYVLDSKTGKATKRPKEQVDSWKRTQLIINAIHKLRSQYKDIPIEIWEQERKKRFDFMRETVREDVPGGWEAIEIVLTTKGIQHIRDITLPFIVIQINNPAEYKTFGMDTIQDFPNIVRKDKISNHSWVTHVAKDDPKELETIDLIREMKDSMFMVPELAPIFMQREDILADALSTLIRLADGNGLVSHSGMYGDRGIGDSLMFTMIGAIVSTPQGFHRLLASLGPKIYFYTSNVKKVTKQILLDEMKKERFVIRKERIQDAVISYLEWLEVCPSLKDVNEHLKNSTGESETETTTEEKTQEAADPDNVSNKPRMIKRVTDWHQEKDEQEALDMIASLALLIAKIRGSAYAQQSKVMISLDDAEVEGSTESGSGYQYEYAHSKPTEENPIRANEVLRNVAVAHGFELHGRDHVTVDDLPIILKIVLSSANKERIAVVKAMIQAKDVSGIVESELETTRKVDISHLVGTTHLINKTRISKSQLHRIVKELSTLDLIDIYKAGKNNENYHIFKSDF